MYSYIYLKVNTFNNNKICKQFQKRKAKHIIRTDGTLNCFHIYILNIVYNVRNVHIVGT